jgi:leucine-rich repeat protein SHOC2
MKLLCYLLVPLLLLLFGSLSAQESWRVDVAQSGYDKSDLAVLEEIIRINQLELSPLSLGRQVWNRGRLAWFALGEDKVKISKLPENFGSLSALTHLYLPGNHLKQLPCSIGNLENLQALYLNDNALTCLPASLGNLQNLQNLYLNGNQLTSIPESLGKLTQLQNLYLNDNEIEQIPRSVAILPALRNLYF